MKLSNVAKIRAVDSMMANYAGKAEDLFDEVMKTAQAPNGVYVATHQWAHQWSLRSALIQSADTIQQALDRGWLEPSASDTEDDKVIKEGLRLQVSEAEAFFKEKRGWAKEEVISKISIWRQKRHPDDAAVDKLAEAMKAKLAKQREKGYGGWDTDCTQQRLSDMLRAHVDKGDPVDVANLCAFLLARGEGIVPKR